MLFFTLSTLFLSFLLPLHRNFCFVFFFRVSHISSAAPLVCSLLEFSDEYISLCFKVSLKALKSNRGFPGSIQYLLLSTLTSAWLHLWDDSDCGSIHSRRPWNMPHRGYTNLMLNITQYAPRILLHKNYKSLWLCTGGMCLNVSFKISVVSYRVWISTATCSISILTACSTVLNCCEDY